MKSQTGERKDKKEECILAIETGNEYEGILILKGIQLAFRLRRPENRQ